jgi:excisionase family DNA binding protein
VKRIISCEQLRNRELLRISEAASVLGESRANVYLRIKRGEVKAVRFGKTMLVHGPSLFGAIDRLLRESGQEGAAA